MVALGHHIQMAHDTDLVLAVTEINIAAVPLMILGTEAIVPAPLQSKVQHLPAILTVGGAGLGQIGPGYRGMGDPEFQLLDHLLLMVGDPLVHKGFYHFLIYFPAFLKSVRFSFSEKVLSLYTQNLCSSSRSDSTFSAFPKSSRFLSFFAHISLRLLPFYGIVVIVVFKTV